MRSALLLMTVSLLARPAAAGIDRWTPIGPDGGYVMSIAAHPDAPATLYVGTSGGGVWKSLDGGGSWGPTPDGLPSTPITSLAVTSSGVVAAHYYSLYFLAEGASAWLPVGPFPYDVKRLEVDPERPELVWAAGDFGGILLSEDGGEHWSRKLRFSGSFTALTIAPTSPPTVYVSGGDGIFASTDLGTTWRQLTPIFDIGRAVDLDVDPEDPSILYASAGYSGGFWKSTDAGAHWTFSTNFTPYRTLALSGALLSSGLYLGRSTDGGESWRLVGLPTWGEVDVLEADRAAPDGAWVSVRGGGGGFFHTLDGGQTWTRGGRQGLRASNIQAFSFDPFRPGTVYAATPEEKLQRSVDGGASWSRLSTVLEARSLAADPKRSGTLYAGTPRGVSVSHDRGLTWKRVLLEETGIDAVVVDPNRPGTVWAGGYRLWRSRDGGTTWTRIKRPPGSSGPSVARRIYLSPWHPDTIYYIDFYLDGFDRPGALWRSIDDGKTWQALGASEPVALSFDPVTPDLLYAADYFEGVRRSRDGGTTWELVGNPVFDRDRLTAVLVDRLDPSILYVGTESFSGTPVWRSLDGGVTWEPFSTGLPGPAITCLEAYARNPRRLVACTRGGGLQEMRISSGS